MRLRGKNFGPILDASGVQGFHGEGYWYHRYLRPVGLDFTGCGFLSKTSTLPPNKGNMPMREDGVTPIELFPKCVKVYFRKGMMLNAVSLSGPGFEALLETGLWQSRRKPFGISVMAIGKTPEERLAETRGFVTLLKKHLKTFRAPMYLQENESCPNVGLDLNCLVDEGRAKLDILAELGIPIMLKYNILAPVKLVKAITEHEACDAICVSNTIPWGAIPYLIDWEELFGTDISPLAEFGGGGLSGAPLLPLVVNWLKSARYAHLNKPINAGGGILAARDLSDLYCAGANSVFIGSVATLRPWRVQQIIHRAHCLFGR